MRTAPQRAKATGCKPCPVVVERTADGLVTDELPSPCPISMPTPIPSARTSTAPQASATDRCLSSPAPWPEMVCAWLIMGGSFLADPCLGSLVSPRYGPPGRPPSTVLHIPASIFGRLVG